MTPSPQARHILADAIAAQGPGWRNAANLVRTGGYVNAWIAAALMAVDEALRQDADDE